MSMSLDRRTLLRGAGATALAGGLSVAAGTGTAHAARDGFGLRIHPDSRVQDSRLEFFRSSTDAIGWQGSGPGVNVLLPRGYHTSGKRYPVLYLLHGGTQDFIVWMNGMGVDLRALTADKELIVVMPDGGQAGWYSNPVSSNVGPRNWEHFHMAQLIPWIDANFRTWGEYGGRAISGFSMGAFGAMKYTAKYYGHFASVSSHSGPTDLRRDNGIVVHWANLSSAAAELGGGLVYGAPWDQARVTADNPMERVPSYHNKRIFMVAGTDGNIWHQHGVGNFTEAHVLSGQRSFGAALARAGIRHERHEESGGHFLRSGRFEQDLDGIVRHLRRAG